MKRIPTLILFFATIKLVVQLLGNRNYGFHRDELLHLSVGEHLDWGFMEFPPGIAFLGKLSHVLFDASLMGTRLFPTIAGVLILILCCQMALALGGKYRSVLLAAMCILAFLPFYRNHTLFQPVAFDQLWWTLGFYLLIRYVNSEKPVFLLLTGLVLGLGLMTKYTMLVWAFGIFIGLLFPPTRKVFRSPWLYAGGILALVIWLPNLLWQWEHEFPLFRHLQALQTGQEGSSPQVDFMLNQLILPATFVVSVIGAGALLSWQKYRSLGVAALIIFFTLLMLGAKSYYVFAVYPVLFAAGSVKLEQWMMQKKMTWTYLLAASILVPFIPFIPQLTPILPIETFVKYEGLEPQNCRYELTSDYADMFGWEEQAQLVDSVYRSLSPEDQVSCVIWAENYGEAGAIKILGKSYGLPNPISRHGSFWNWGYGNPDASVWISLGNEFPAVNDVFEEVLLIKMIYHPYAIDEEHNIPLYLCRNPKVDIPKWWQEYKPYVFQ
ncbi:MAG: glycosyltransferase family 39 protein [Bacteroidota bacterium]